MSKRSIYTIITPLPSTISRATALDQLHNHTEMIQLNPLVVNHSTCRAPPFASADEFHCIWYELTDRISYLPGGLAKGNVSYKACFHDLPRGVQTHVYAPAGLEIKEKWSVGGNEAGEQREVIELGLGANVPREGLYLREDVDMRCNLFLTGFVKKTLKKAHGVLVDRLVVKADLADDARVRAAYKSDTLASASTGSPSSSSHPAVKSRDAATVRTPRSTPSDASSSTYTQEMPGSPPLTSAGSRASHMSYSSSQRSSVHPEYRVAAGRPHSPTGVSQPWFAELPAITTPEDEAGMRPSWPIKEAPPAKSALRQSISTMPAELP